MEVCDERPSVLDGGVGVFIYGKDPGGRLRHQVYLYGQLCDDAKSPAAAAADRPKYVRVLACVGSDDVACRRNDSCFNDAVSAHAVLAGEPAVAAGDSPAHEANVLVGVSLCGLGHSKSKFMFAYCLPRWFRRPRRLRVLQQPGKLHHPDSRRQRSWPTEVWRWSS